jgi:aminomuconate-semialdehyde/2-hydroxymuconate-6-semialdehyde dehydrogenase
LDIPRAIENFRYFADFGRTVGSESHASEAGGFHYTHRRPVGVVGLITPWNLPLYLLSWKIAPALMMGNCIVAKPRSVPNYSMMMCVIFSNYHSLSLHTVRSRLLLQLC